MFAVDMHFLTDKSTFLSEKAACCTVYAYKHCRAMKIKPQYICLLFGINVNIRKVVRMAKALHSSYASVMPRRPNDRQTWDKRQKYSVAGRKLCHHSMTMKQGPVARECSVKMTPPVSNTRPYIMRSKMHYKDAGARHGNKLKGNMDLWSKCGHPDDWSPCTDRVSKSKTKSHMKGTHKHMHVHKETRN